jgi:Predicted Zn-dependent protease (DUF2268)
MDLQAKFAASILAAVAAIAPPANAAAPHALDIDNRVPKFQTFYAHAARKPLSADARFSLWQKEDGLAAVPPGPDGDKMARQLLDAAWDRYPALIPKLPKLTDSAKATARSAFAKINSLLGTKNIPIHSRLVLYVGQFDNNAYTVPPMAGKSATVLMPVENIALRVQLAHELTHSVHIQLAHVKNSFGGPVGETMFLEGLAMRVSQRAVPGLPETAYTQMPTDKDWLEECYAKKEFVLAAIAPDLDRSGRDIAMKYTFGNGNTGMKREVYCAAWIVMGSLLQSGKTLSEIARIPEDRMVATMRDAMASR